jgi:hypothetical protein
VTGLRRWILVLSFSASFALSAFAQVGGGGPPAPLGCNLNTMYTPTLRSEGVTEEVGDIVITCTGGPEIPNLGTGAGNNPPAPTTDITVALNNPVTSRILGLGGISEALLLIDEPNSGEPVVIPGFGAGEPFTPCPKPTNGCPTYVLTQTGGGSSFQTGVTSSSATTGKALAAPNVYQGVVSGNHVTFYDVPVIPPATNGARVLRISNLRVSGVGLPPDTPVQAAITTSNPSALPLNETSIVTGFARFGLITAVAEPTAFQRCNAQTLSQSAVLTFQEPLASRFKTRVDPNVAGQINGQGNALVQNRPGTIYNSESWFTLSGLYGTGTAGLADFGTRFTAVFHNIPQGVSVFVSQFGVTLNSSGTATGEVSSGSSWAQAVSSETAPDGAGTIPAAPVYGMLAPGGNGNIHVVELTRQSDGTAMASWESMANTPTAIDTYNFAVFVSYPARSAGVGTARVSLRFGPESGGSTDSVPRFFEITGGTDAISIGACQP